MPKIKTHSGCKKRIKITGTGKYAAKRCGTSHLLYGRKRTKRLHKDMVISETKTKKLQRAMPNG